MYLDIKNDTDKDFIIDLLKQDLRLYRIRSGLNELGIHSDEFYTEIPEIIIRKLGYDAIQYDNVMNFYCEFLNGLDFRRLGEKEFLESMARKAYSMIRVNKL